MREWYKHRARAEPPDDLERMNEEILLLDRAIEEYADLAATTRNENVRLGAINAKVRTQDRRLALYRATGAFPDELRRIKNRIDVEKFGDVLNEVLHRLEMEIPNHVVPRDIMERFWQLCDELSDSPETTRAREAQQRQETALKKKEKGRQHEKQRRDIQRERYAEHYHVGGQEAAAAG